MVASKLVLELRVPHARVAALLAPGPLSHLEGVVRVDLGSLSGLPDRSVVRIVRLSGLDDLGPPFAGGKELYGGRDGGCEEDEASNWSRIWSIDERRPTTTRSDELLEGREGRCGRGGLDSSGYVMAGIVPSPIHPLLGVAG